MTNEDSAAKDLERSSEQWLAWLAGEVARRRHPPGSALSAGARHPDALAGQLLTLVEGAMAGALIDRHPQVARHARELTRIALAGS
jgi:hypothetical protein